MKPYYQEKKETVEFKVNKIKTSYSKIKEYRDVVGSSFVNDDYFHNTYKTRILKNSVKMK